MASLARWRWGSLFFAIVLLLSLVTACDAPWEVSTMPLQTATPNVVVPPTYIPPPTPTSPTNGSVISQTLEGVTISVAPLHADAHRVVLALRIDGPARPYRYALELAWSEPGKEHVPTLSVQGEGLPWLENVGTRNISGAIAAAGQPIQGQGVLRFDASRLKSDGGVDNAARSLPLHLSLAVRKNNHPDEDWPPRPIATSVARATEPPTQVPPPSRILPFDFSFEVPFDSERIVLQPAQTIEENGLKMTLERVDITASEALITVHYLVTNLELFRRQRNPGAYANLMVPSETGSADITLVGEPDWAPFHGNSEGDILFSYSEPLLLRKAPVDCTLTVEAGSSGPIHGSNPSLPPALGTGVFHFTVPAASSQK